MREERREGEREDEMVRVTVGRREGEREERRRRWRMKYVSHS